MDMTRMLKQPKNRGGEKNEEQEETLEFTGSSGEQVNGAYHDLVHSWKTLSWQSNDAEVDLLQAVSNFLRTRQHHQYGQITLYMRGSKGPCTSCRKLIALFRQDFPNVKIICEYRQRIPQERDAASKSQGQDPLTYGYVDAVSLFPGEKQSNKESYCKVLPAFAHGIQVPQGLKGFAMTTLEGFFRRYVEQYDALDPASVQQFVQKQHETVLPHSQARNVGTWLRNRLLYEEQVILSAQGLSRLLSLDSPSAGSDVTIYALLCLARIAPPPDWQKKRGGQRKDPFAESDQEERKEKELDEDVDGYEKLEPGEDGELDEENEEEEQESEDEETSSAMQSTTIYEKNAAREAKEESKGAASAKKELPMIEGSKKLRQRITKKLPGIGVLVNVSGDGMNCLIRALLVASGNKDDEVTVSILRDELDRAQVSHTGTMLNLASAAGAILVSYMEFAGFINANRRIVVYIPAEDGTIIQHVVYQGKNEKDPIMLWLSDEHFQAIVQEKKS
jgi:hypothetical protein